MKKVLVLVMLAPVMVWGQKKGVTKIIIDSVSFNEVAEHLLDAGYFIDKSDSAFGTFITLPRQTPKQAASKHKLLVRVKDNKAIVTGQFDMTMYISGVYDISNSGAKGFPGREAFAAMNKFALSFNRPVEYSK